MPIMTDRLIQYRPPTRILHRDTIGINLGLTGKLGVGTLAADKQLTIVDGTAIFKTWDAGTGSSYVMNTVMDDEGVWLYHSSVIRGIGFKWNGVKRLYLDTSGNPRAVGPLTVDSGTSKFGGHVYPLTGGTWDLGGTGAPDRWRHAFFSGQVFGQGLAVFSSLQVDGGLQVDTNTLFVDAVNNRVGVRRTDPVTAFDVVGDGRFTSNLQVEGALQVPSVSGIHFEASSIQQLSTGVVGNLLLIRNGRWDGTKYVRLAGEQQAGMLVLGQDGDLQYHQAIDVNLGTGTTITFAQRWGITSAGVMTMPSGAINVAQATIANDLTAGTLHTVGTATLGDHPTDTHVVNGQIALPNQARTHVRPTVGLSTTLVNTQVPVVWGAEDFDTSGSWVSGDTLTVMQAGDYFIAGFIMAATAGTLTGLTVRLIKNGTAVWSSIVTIRAGGDSVVVPVMHGATFAQFDTISVTVAQNTAGTLLVDISSNLLLARLG